MNEDVKHFSMNSLCSLVEMPRRKVRFYIQTGLVDRPFGDNPRNAYYTQRHIEQLLTIRKWQQAGLSLERIKELIEGQESDVPPRPIQSGQVEVWSRMFIHDGIELNVEPERAELAPEEVRMLFQEVINAYKRVKPNREE